MSNEIIKVEGQTGLIETGWNLSDGPHNKYIYFASNPIYPNVIKIGCTNSHPTYRIKQLSQIILDDFILVDFVGFNCNVDIRKIESIVHEHFQLSRIKRDREFFKQDCLQEAISLCKDLSITMANNQAELLSEEQRQKLVESGITVVANSKHDLDLINWAKQQKKFVFIGRGKFNLGWGNPYELTDGGRDVACNAHIEYFKYKKSLHTKIEQLKGKVLSCYCYPKRCHGDYLAKLANGET